MVYRKEIDGLRAIAVLAVILFHADYQFFKGGFIGVDIFFVISGYLINSIVLAEKYNFNFKLMDFYERRARRLLPALFLVMLITVPVCYIYLPPEELAYYSESLIATTFFVSNILFFLQSGYFDSLANLKPLLHTWSLAVEGQFYLFFPILIMILWRYARNKLLIALVLLIAISFSLTQLTYKIQAGFTFYLLPTRAWEILSGAALAIHSHHRTQVIPLILRQTISLVGMILIAFSIVWFNKNTPSPGIYTIIPIAGTLLLITFATVDTVIGRILSNCSMVWIGSLSYSFYLWHQPVFALSKQIIAPENYLVSRPILIGLSLLCGYYSWRFVEIPFRNKYIVGTRNFLSLSGITVFVFLCCGLSGYFTNGFPQRTDMAKFLVFNNKLEKQGYKNCNDTDLNIGEPINFCFLSNRGNVNAAVIGDSHAADKFYGIEKNVTQYNWALFGNAACPPVIGVQVHAGNNNCDTKFRKIINYLKKHEEIKIVVLSFYGNYSLSSAYAANHLLDDNGPETFKITSDEIQSIDRVVLFSYGLKRSLDELFNAGKQVYLFIDVPELPFLPLDCEKSHGKCTILEQDVINRQTMHRAMIQQLSGEYPQLMVFDPIDIFCKESICSYKKNDIVLYNDSHHLTFVGSDLYGQQIKERFFHQR